MGFSYGYNRAESLDDYKSARNCLLLLIDTVSRGGNLLLDIGPNADGTIPVIMQQRLVEMGDWLRVNGEAIYGTRFAGRSCQWTDGPVPAQQFGEYRVKYDLMDLVGQKAVHGHAVKQVYFTQKADVLYAITVGWPERELLIRDVHVSPGSGVTLLGRDGTVETKVLGDSLRITMPPVSPDELPCRYAYVLRIPGAHLLQGK